MDRKLSALTPILRLFAVFVVLWTGSGYADTNQDQTVQALEAILKKDVFPLDREMVGFHWEQQNQGWEPSGLADVQRHILNWSSHFFAANGSTNDNVGPGVYLAFDPLATRSYGGSDETAELYVVTVKQGAPILNATRSLTDPERASLNQFTVNNNCGTSFAPANMHDFTEVMENVFLNSSETCRGIIQQVMKDLKVEAVLYTYTSSYLPNCRDQAYALNVISPNAMKPEGMAFYDGKSLLETAPVSGMVRRAWDEAIRYDVGTSLYLQKGMNQLPAAIRAADYPPDMDYKNWKNKIYRCGTVWGAENISNLSGLNDMIHFQLSDDELHDLIVQFEMAYRARSGSPFGFPYYSLRKFYQEEYKASGWTSDTSKFSQWTHAANQVMSDSRSTNSLIAVEGLLEEPTSIPPNRGTNEYLRPISNTFKVEDAQNPAIMFVAYQKAGMGPRLARIIVNLNIELAGGAPFLADMPALNTSGTDLVKANKEAVKGILRECMKTFQDQKQTLDEINAGPCGPEY
jgi:hypothetical protein